MNTRFYYLIFFLLYFAQGSALAYFTNFQKPFLSHNQIEYGQISLLTSLLLAPFILKIFFGYLSDNFSFLGLGHRKPYLFLGLVLSSLMFLSVSFLNLPDKYLFFSILIFISSISIALFDATADGLAIEKFNENQFARIQSFMIAGKSFGILLISYVIGLIGNFDDFSKVFYFLAIILFLPSIMVVFVKEPTEIKKNTNLQMSILIKNSSILFLFFAVLYSITSFGIDGALTLFLKDQKHFAEIQIGEFGTVRAIGAIFGAIISGFVFRKLEISRYIFIGLFGLIVGSLLLFISFEYEKYLLAAVIWGFFWGFQETVYVTLAMFFSSRNLAATMFAFYMAFSNIGTAIGEALSVQLLSFLSLPLCLFILCLPVAILLFLNKKMLASLTKN